MQYSAKQITPSFLIVTLLAILLVACDPTTITRLIPTATHTALPTVVATAATTATPMTTPTQPPTATPLARPTQLAISFPTPTFEPAAGGEQAYPGLIAHTKLTSNSIDIYTMTADGAHQTRLTHDPGASFQPRWSPDGQFIAFLYHDLLTDVVDIWVIDVAAGIEAYPITEGGVEDIDYLSWSPDNRFLVYHDSQPNGSERDIYRLEIASGEVVNLTADSPVWDAWPAWSPDGKLIAFVSDRSGDGKALDDIWLMAPDGTGLVNLTDNGFTWEDVKPAWSPDSRQIAFYRWSVYGSAETPGGPSGLWVMNVDGSDERLLVEFSGLVYREPPVWSPDGKFIAFNDGAVENVDVWVVPAEGGQAMNLSDLPGEEIMISWSPDSQALIFSSLHQDVLSLYLAAPDGSDRQRLLDSGNHGFGDWSP